MLSEEQAWTIYAYGQEAVVFAVLLLCKQLAEQRARMASESRQTPGTPSGMKPPYQKPRPRGARSPLGRSRGIRASVVRRRSGSTIARSIGPSAVPTVADRFGVVGTCVPATLRTSWKSRHVRQLVECPSHHQNDLFTFLDHANVPFDNNAAERAIRPAVIIPKNSYGNRSQRGADCQSVLMSIFRTLKQGGHDPIRTIVDALATYLTTTKLPSLPEAKTTSTG